MTTKWSIEHIAGCKVFSIQACLLREHTLVSLDWSMKEKVKKKCNLILSSNFLSHIPLPVWNMFILCFCFQNIAVTNTTAEDVTETNEVQGFLFGKLK